VHQFSVADITSRIGKQRLQAHMYTQRTVVTANIGEFSQALGLKIDNWLQN
tara:strand:+ start:1393 stop:1545 length:153 start_codon:yes stop_codon:yes gene_type:complete